jgi:hypothetical protein
MAHGSDIPFGRMSDGYVSESRHSYGWVEWDGYFSSLYINRFGGESVTGFWMSLRGERKVGERGSCSRKMFPFFSDETPIGKGISLSFRREGW